MWECRLIWVSGRPGWWDETWRRGIEILDRAGRTVEQRPDLYLCVQDRPDVGLKIRGANHGDVEIKVLHEQSSGWQLWEKTVFMRWNDLEVARLATILRVRVPPDRESSDTEALTGARQLLQDAGVTATDVMIQKQRMQAGAGELLASIPGHAMHPSDLAELVVIQLPGREQQLFSMCIETMDPGRSAPLSAPGALCCSYPELLVLHTKGAL